MSLCSEQQPLLAEGKEDGVVDEATKEKGRK